MMNVMQFMKKLSGIAKKEIFYIFPFGPTAYLGGVIPIDRQSAKSAHKTLDRCAQLVKHENVKLFIYPEGTRNPNRGFLPFKKGAFITAIKAQVPIIPMVQSHYYFLDQKKRIFDKGKYEYTRTLLFAIQILFYSISSQHVS